MRGTLERLQANWVYGGFLAGLVLLAMTSVFTKTWPFSEKLVYLSLPFYMLHQLEEHDADRFRRFVNYVIGRGHDVLTVRAVFIINVAGVWGVVALSLWLMRSIAPGWGLIAVYLLLINAALHVAQGLVLRLYNPGLATAVALFIPLGVYAIYGLWPLTTPLQHGVSILLVLALHGAIALRVRQRLQRLEAAAASSNDFPSQT